MTIGQAEYFAVRGTISLQHEIMFRFLIHEPPAGRMCYDVCIVRCMEMRTNIVLDDKLVRKAFKLSKAKTKKELVHEALAELVAVREKRDLRELRGKIGFQQDYDYKALRKGRHGGSR